MALRINIPPLTRILLVTQVLLSFFYNLARWRQLGSNEDQDAPQKPALVPYLTMVPSACLFYPWTFLTATFVEQNIFNLLINGATVFFGGKYLERAWGSRSFAVVILIVSVVSNLLMVPTYIIWGGVMRNPTRALTPVAGGIAIQAAFLVAFKQLVPEHTVSLFRGFIKMRVKHFPAVFLALNTISGFLLGTDTALFLAWFGLITSWVYLRFYKRQPDLSGTSTGGQGLKGDASETFAFATLFPNIVQPPIELVCNKIFDLLCTLRICTPFSEEAIASGNEQAAARGEVGLPNLLSHGRSARGMGKREEAERRRALALKALDQRLNASASRAGGGPVTVSTGPASGQEALGQTDYKPDEGQ